MKTVFLSSTSQDLTAYREAAYRAIEGLDGYHCVRMEDFGARNHESDELCREKVRDCDVFVALVGWVYGSEHSSGQSFTEREYQEAVSTDKPRLVFLAPDTFHVPVNLIEDDAKRARQRAFRDRINQERVRDTFTSPDDLGRRVVQALRHWEHETASPLPNTTPSGVPLRPVPPTPYFAHPYPLQSNFTGRVAQRRMLTEWLLNDTRPVLGLIAIGGMGKSSLTWAWVQKDVLGLEVPGMILGENEEAICAVPTERRPKGVFWWSFYEQEARFPAFLNEALVYLSRGQIQPESIETQHDRVRTLLSLLQQENFLLVLDGFERELRGALDDEELEENDEQKSADVRTILDLHAAIFLKWTAAAPLRSRILFTSRLFPRDLDGVAGCRRESLEGLDEEEAVRFFGEQKIRGTRAEIHAVANRYGYHPLALRLLAGMILNDLQSPGDMNVALVYDPLPELVPRRTHVLSWALRSASTQSRQLLSRLSALRSPADYDTALVVAPEASPSEFQTSLRELIDRNLLVQDRQGRFDMHSVVRRYAYRQLALSIQTHAQLATYFSGLQKPSTPRNLEEAKPWIELVHHQARSENYRNAYLTYERHLHTLLSRLGVSQIAVEILEPIAVRERSRPSLKPAEHYHLLRSLAVDYSWLGMPRLCIQILGEAVRVKGMTSDPGASFNLGVCYLQTGEIRKAEEILLQLFGKMQSNSKDLFWHVNACLSLSDARSFMGDFPKAGFYLGRVSALHGMRIDLITRTNLWLSGAFRFLQMEKAAEAWTNIERVAKNHMNIDEKERVRFHQLAGAALIALAKSSSSGSEDQLKQAESHLTEALNRSRRIQFVEGEAYILIEWAKWARHNKNDRLAREYASEAFAIAERSGYRAAEAQICNVLADLEASSGDQTTAIIYALRARERAYCDGPPYYYKQEYMTAESLLQTLNPV